MKLTCPYCQDGLAYDPRQAGKSVVCTFCKRPVLVPQLQALPAELQEEYRQEQLKLAGKREAEQRKQQEAEQRRRQAEETRRRDEADQARRREEAERLALQRQAAERQRAERDRQVRTEWNSQVQAATNMVPEEDAVKNRYPALRTIASAIKVIAITLIVIIGVGGSVGGLATFAGGSPVIGMLTAAWAVVASVLVWMFYFALAELILLAIDVANDIRINRLLLKGMRYHPREDAAAPFQNTN